MTKNPTFKNRAACCTLWQCPGRAKNSQGLGLEWAAWQTSELVLLTMELPQTRSFPPLSLRYTLQDEKE